MSEKRRNESTVENEITAYIRRVHKDQASVLRRALIHKEVRKIERERYELKEEIGKIEKAGRSTDGTGETGESPGEVREGDAGLD